MTDDTLRDRLQHSLGAAYSLDHELGGGGMSRVFVADDVRLRRKVVVKVLSPELAAGISAERFEREITLAASLQQANIVPVLAAGITDDGLPYYTMPYVEGRALRERLRDGALPVAEAVSVLRDLARALAYAHERGIVHRDIKPENILLSGGAAVVTDFGIAKALSASRTQAPGGTLTQVGTSLGTPAYMAPEQAAGDPATDHRADLYAVGCVAYEMLSGAAPFAGRPVHQLFSAHLSETPAALPAGVPRGLATLVARCLEKDPTRRPATAAEILQSLDAATTGNAHAPVRRRPALGRAIVVALVGLAAVGAWRWSTRARDVAPDAGLSAVAVLPFENASGDTASNYFADGMTDELATALAKVPGLRVASRTSSYTFRKRDGVDARTIASRLNVGAIVEGSVRRAGTQLRVTAQLTRGGDGQSLWADAFTASADSVFAVQARLTQAIVAAITPALTGARPDDARAAATPATKDPIAYDAYLRARYELNHRGAGVMRSIPLFAQAIARDSSFAAAWSGLASAWVLAPDYDLRYSAAAVLDSVRRAAAVASSLDSRAAEPYAALGYALSQAGRFGDAIPTLARAVQRDSRSGDGERWLGLTYSRIGRIDDAEQHLRAAIVADPLAGLNAATLAVLIAHDPARRDEARLLARRGVSLDPSNMGAVGNAVMALFSTGDYREALDAMRGMPFDGGVRLTLGLVANLAAVGRTDSLVVIRRALTARPRTPIIAFELATIAAGMQHWDEALAQVDFGATEIGTLDPLFNLAPLWRPVAGDPRLRATCARIKVDCDAVLGALAHAAPLSIPQAASTR